jgi:hypothetical protein
VIGNSNLKTHTVRLTLKPSEAVTLNVLYFYQLLDEPAAAGVRSDRFAQELDLIADYTLNDTVSFSAVGAVSRPERGGEQFTGGDDEWYYGMLYTKLSF